MKEKASEQNVGTVVYMDEHVDEDEFELVNRLFQLAIVAC